MQHEESHGAVPKSLNFEVIKTPDIQRVIQTNDDDAEDGSLDEEEVLGIAQPPQPRLIEDMLQSPNTVNEVDMSNQVGASPDMMKDVSPIETRMEESQTDEFPVFTVDSSEARESIESNQSNQTRESVGSVNSPGEEKITTPSNESMLRRVSYDFPFCSLLAIVF